MKIIAVIPTHGRFELLKYTVQRLYEKNKVNEVICIGDTGLRKCKYIQYKNYPLGEKWNRGFQEARKLKADAVLYVGSSDWISDNWIPTMVPHLKVYDMVGKLDYNMSHVNDKITLLKFKGYTDPKFSFRTFLVRHSLRQFLFGNDRTGEPIGIGRLIRAEFLDKINWKPFIDEYHSSMDWCMMQKLYQFGNYKVYTGDDIQSLAISCDKWTNMHWTNLERYMPNIEKITDPDWIEKWFPELLNFKSEL